MKYYFNKTVECGFDEAVTRTQAALASEGFGIISEIDISATFKKKLDIDFPKYRILGACSPHHAHKALLAEAQIGTMLPCNVIVRETGNQEVEIAAIDPIASMMAVQNDSLGEIAREVRNKLINVVEKA